MEITEAKELIGETIQRFGNISNTRIIEYKITKNLSRDACTYHRDFSLQPLQYKGLIRFKRKALLEATKSKIICLIIHELAHTMPSSIIESLKEDEKRKKLEEIIGKDTGNEVSWYHGRDWKRVYKGLISTYKIVFPGVIKDKDVKEYYPSSQQAWFKL
jgi:hypothetical protein